jgi:hypothetical protein
MLMTSRRHLPTAASQSPRLGSAITSLIAHDWATRKAAKSQATLFTSDTHQSRTNPEVSINLSPIDLTFDPHFTFTPHVASVISRANERLKIMKAHSGTSWGHQMETQLVTFKSLIRSLITYACPVWFPNLSKANITDLQTVQNKALRIATGAHQMAHIDHLHSEAKVLPVNNHLTMLCTQFLASALRPYHPSHQIVNSYAGPSQETPSN